MSNTSWFNKDEFKKNIISNCKSLFRKNIDEADKQQLFQSVAYAVKEIIIDRWIATQKEYAKQDKKTVYYMSMEFLMGRALGNNMINLIAYDEMKEVLEELGMDINVIEDQEPDAALGNGGLGRLAACFLDSLATLEYPAYGCGIRYKYGMFKQEIKDGYQVICEEENYACGKCVVSVGRSGSKWMEKVCEEMSIPTSSNRVDLGVRVELPAVIFSHLTDELYESKIVYRTKQFEDNVRTFCMNPYGIVVSENTNGIVTVNGHSYEDPTKQTENTNFALLVSKHFSEPFKDSNGYGESIARLSNMLGGGVMVQRFGDLVRGRRSTVKRVEEGIVRPTLSATPGDLSLVLPKRILDGIIEMIYALDKIAPGTANDDTLLYGVEVKFYNMEVQLDEHLESIHKGLYIIGDGSGVTHSLSHASASGVYVAREILESMRK